MNISIEIIRAPQWTMLAAGLMGRRFAIVIGPMAISVGVERAYRY